VQYVTLTFDVYQVCHGVGRSVNKNSSGDEIANVNFFTTTSYNTSKYNPCCILITQHDAGRGAASGCGWPRGISALLQPRPYLL